MTEKQIAHAHPALTEPAQRTLIEAGVPVLVGDVGADALAEFGRDLVGRLAHRGERGTLHRARAREERIDRGAKEAAMTTRGGEDGDLSVVRAAAQRGRIDTEQTAGIPGGAPVAVVSRGGRCATA